MSENDPREEAIGRARRILILFVGGHALLALVPTCLGVYRDPVPAPSIVGWGWEFIRVYVFHLGIMPTLICGLPALAVFLLIDIRGSS